MQKNKYALTNCKIITPFRIIYPATLIVNNSKIEIVGLRNEIEIPKGMKKIDCHGFMLTPGFIDLLVHGGGGFGFADQNEKALKNISEFYFSKGTTGMLASLYSKPLLELQKDIKRISTFASKNKGNIWGIHLEGPFINSKLHGAMKKEFLWKPDVNKWKKLSKVSKGFVKIMTIAPELENSSLVMREAAADGVVLSIGHSESNYHEIEIAIDNGAAHVTHIFNAMNEFHHRNPGVIAAALMRNELKVELIADAIHVHPIVMKLIYKLKGAGGINLITDSIRACGMPDGIYNFMEQNIFVKNDKATLKDGTLAGSTLTLNKAIKNMVELVDVPLTEAVRMASLNGAKVLNVENKKGIIASGKDADLVLMNNNFDVMLTIFEGKIKFINSNFKINE